MGSLKKIGKGVGAESISVEKYLQEVRKIALISQEEEAILAQKIRLGDEKALEKLVKSSLRFVVSIAKTFQGKGLSLGELITEGNNGLLESAKRFDENKGVRFISYARHRIIRSILSSFDYCNNQIKLPRNSEKNICSSLDEIAPGGENDLHEYFGFEDSFGGGRMLDGDQSLEFAVMCSFHTLTRYEKEILVLIFGIGTEAVKPKVIANSLAMSVSDVYNIKNRALKKLSRNSELKCYI